MGVGLACGFGGVVAVDIDDETLIEPILPVLPPALIAKRGRKGLTAFYRADEPLPSKNYRTKDRRGLLDFLSRGKQTVLPPTLHKDTGEPYRWITPATLCNTPLDTLPTFTSTHVAAMEAILARMGGRLLAAPRRIAKRSPRLPRPPVQLLAILTPLLCFVG